MIFLILILGILLRVFALTQSFWLDEAVQAVLSAKELTAIPWSADFQPPLYYAIIHFWIKYGHINSEWFLRLPSVASGVGLIYAVYYFANRWFGSRIAVLASILVATSPMLIYYSQELRMYSFLSLLVFLSWAFLHEKRWRSFALVTALALFTHYFAFVCLVAQCIYVLVSKHYERQSTLNFCRYTALALLPFIAWIPTFLAQIHTSSELISLLPNWKAVSNIEFLKLPILTLAKFTVGMISPHNRMVYGIAVITSAGIYLVCALYILRKLIMSSFKNSNQIHFLISFAILPFLLTWVAGLWIPAVTPTRIQFILPALLILISVALSQLSHREIKYFLTGSILFMNLFFTFTYLLDSQYHRENWRDAVAFTDVAIKDSNNTRKTPNQAQKPLVLTKFHQPFAPIEWYSTDSKLTHYSGASTSPNLSQESVAQKLGPALRTERPATILVYTYLFQITDPNNQLEKYLESKNYVLTQEKDFRGVGIIKIFTHN